jgi:thioredoxin
MDLDRDPRVHSRPHRLQFAGVASALALTALALAALVVVPSNGPRGLPDTAERVAPNIGPECGGSPPPSQPVWVSDRKFRKVVLKAEVPVLVEFGAVWCLPCRKMVPALNALAADFVGRALVVRVDIDADPYLAQDLGVDSLPTTILFQDGRPVRRFVGGRSREELARLLDQLLAEVETLGPDQEHGTAAG